MGEVPACAGCGAAVGNLAVCDRHGRADWEFQRCPRAGKCVCSGALPQIAGGVHYFLAFLARAVYAADGPAFRGTLQ